MPARFFLSYARSDEDGYVAKFFDDLVREVQRHSGVGGDELGFQDVASMRVGASWAQELFDALNTSATFVALCSPSYFASEFCGREWAMFSDRAEEYQKRHGTTSQNLLPVLWVPAPEVPGPVSRLQYTDPTFGSAYAQEGLYYLLKLKRYRQDYLLVLRGLAQRIVEVARANPLPSMDGTYSMSNLRSAFHGPRPRQAPVAPASSAPVADRPADARPVQAAPPARSTVPPMPPARARRSGHVYFVIVAGHKQELAQVRNELQHYGREPFDWAPYRPELDQRMSVFAQSVAADQDLSSQLAEAAEVHELLDRAAGRNELVVLLVDVWTTRIDSYRTHMNEYDRRNEPSSAVMVPLSQDDNEAAEDAERLNQDLERAFPRNVVRSDDLFRAQIGTSSGFREDLADVLAKAQGRIFRSGEVGRWTGSESRARPMIQFPDREADR